MQAIIPPAAQAPVPQDGRPGQPAPMARFSRAVDIMLDAGRDLLGRIRATLGHGATPSLPRNLARNLATAERRVERTMEWVHALARTLAGDRNWLIPFTIPRICLPRDCWLTARLRTELHLPQASASPPRTEEQRAHARLRTIRRSFATQPIAKIATRLARALGGAPNSGPWPTDLLDLHETPAAWATRIRAEHNRAAGIPTASERCAAILRARAATAAASTQTAAAAAVSTQTAAAGTALSPRPQSRAAPPRPLWHRRE